MLSESGPHAWDDEGFGIHLAFFSGNESFWKTRWEPSTARYCVCDTR